MRRSWIAVAALALALGGGELFAGKGGGGKKPPPDEPPPDPAIAFVVSSGGNGELTVTNEDGSNLTVLLSAADGASEPLQPTWSPDGGKLAFRFDDGTNGDGIYTLDVVVDGNSVYGANLTQILSTSASSGPNNFSWSPVPVFGKYRIAFSMDGEVYLVNADGTGDLTGLDKVQGDISWSPTGDRLATTPNHRSLKIHHLKQDEPGGPIYVGYSPRYDLYDGELMRVWNVAWANTQDHVLAVAVAPDSSTAREDLWIVDLRDGVLDPDAPPEHIDVFVLETHIALTNTSSTGEVYPTWSSDDLALLFSLEGGRSSGLYVLDDLSGTADPSVFYRNKKKSAWWPDWRR